MSQRVRELFVLLNARHICYSSLPRQKHISRTFSKSVLSFNSNILALLNAFELPEGSINESNYEETLNRLNGTSSSVIQGLDLETCDIQTFLSQVRIYISLSL